MIFCFGEYFNIWRKAQLLASDTEATSHLYGIKTNHYVNCDVIKQSGGDAVG
jgi:hypothetical protein